MFKAFFTQTISVDDRQSEERIQWRYILCREYELPFVPSTGMAFQDEEDSELQAEYVFWDMQEERFHVRCGGMLAQDEDCAKESLEYELAKEWKLLQSRKES